MQAINKYRFFTFIAVLVWSTAFISPLQGCRCSGPADFCSSLGSDLDSDHSVFVIATIDLIGTTRMRARLIKRLFGDPIFTEFWIEGGDEGDCITGTWRFTSGQVYLFHLGIHDRKYYTTICATDWLPIEDGIVIGAFSPTMVDRPLVEV